MTTIELAGGLKLAVTAVPAVLAVLSTGAGVEASWRIVI